MKERKSIKSTTSRREFIKKSAIASSVFLVPRHVLGGLGYTAPSDQLNLAAIGAGGKGASDIRNASVKGRERIVALCDVDFSGSAKASVEKFPKATLYNDFRVMLDKEKILMPLQSPRPIMFMAQQLPFAWREGSMSMYKNQ